MSDRGTPDGYRHINGYSSHTFRWTNKDGEYKCQPTGPGSGRTGPDRANFKYPERFDIFKAGRAGLQRRTDISDGESFWVKLHFKTKSGIKNFTHD